MNIKQKATTFLLALAMFVGATFYAAPAFAADSCKPDKGEMCCGGTQTAIIGGSACSNVVDKSGKAQESGIWAVLLLVLNIMTAGVGILGVGGVVYGAVLYSSAGDKAEQTKKAMSIITNVVIGLIAYGMMYLVLNFLIPGGIFS